MISVIIPVYRYTNFLKLSINSVLKQNVPCQIICVSDKADSKVLACINQIKNNLSKESLFKLKLIELDNNLGPGIARKVGVIHSVYDVIAFLDSDDIWPNTYLDERLSLINFDSLFFTASPYSYYYDDDLQVGRNLEKSRNWPHQFITHDDFKAFNPIANSTVIVSKKLLQCVGYYSSIYKRNDYATWLRISRLKNCTYHSNVSSVTVNRLPHSLSSRKATLLYYQYLCFRDSGFNVIESIYCSLKSSIRSISF